MILEVCTNSFQSAKNAQDAGAQRIELCQELSVGGITPSYGLLKKVMDELHIETFVLIRPRSGNFVYSEAEFEIMKADIELCKQLGCHGIVSGVLNTDNTLDATRTQELIALSKPLSFTFHRAFDEVPNPEETLEKLIELGVSRLLTSGQQASAEKGIDLLIQLKKQTQDRLTILPGSGINPSNAKLFKEANFKEIHASASVIIETKNSSHYNEPITVSSKETIRDILKTVAIH